MRTPPWGRDIQEPAPYRARVTNDVAQVLRDAFTSAKAANVAQRVRRALRQSGAGHSPNSIDMNYTKTPPPFPWDK